MCSHNRTFTLSPKCIDLGVEERNKSDEQSICSIINHWLLEKEGFSVQGIRGHCAAPHAVILSQGLKVQHFHVV
jgi:hypothetical protein